MKDICGDIKVTKINVYQNNEVNEKTSHRIAKQSRPNVIYILN